MPILHRRSSETHLIRWVCSALFVLLVPAIPALASFEPVTCRNSFTQQQEIAEGNKVALTIYQQMPILPENDPVTRYVQQLGARLVQSAPLAPGVTQQWPFNFHVVASQDINAFALPGGSIFVNLGTVQAAETEAQLAGVMAHEISHVVMRHSTCNIGKQRTKSLEYGLGQIASQIFLGNGAAGQLAQAGIGGAASLDMLHMSRDDEKQADLLGVNILNNAGYDPRGLPQFFETIKAKYGAGGAQFLSDHPNPGNRTQYVDQEIATLAPRSNPLVTTAQFRQVHAIAMQRHALSGEEVKAGSWKGSGQYASRPGANGSVISSTPVNQTQQSGGTQQQGGTQQGGGTQQQGGTQQGGGTQQAAQAIRPLSRAQLGLGSRMQRLQADRFALRFPSTWQQSTDQTGTVTLAPSGGAGSFGLAYGVVVSVEKQDGNGVSDAQSLSQATSALAQRFGQNSGPTVTSNITSRQVAGRPADSVYLRGSSPVNDGGAQLAERDWLVTIARQDGDLLYLVFVAPERDFNTLQPTFNAILASVQPQ